METPFRRSLAWQKGKGQQHLQLHNFFESMPIYRLKLEVPRGSGFFDLPPFLINVKSLPSWQPLAIWKKTGLSLKSPA
ncbi:MAG: hypothetical protein EOP02_00140 [Proteobacteria bacterium]|nr:MAG: hypothetical protein EOP02_00140 [Pseudomonadota bacterium]